mgnify:CR=1 FL=1
MSLSGNFSEGPVFFFWMLYPVFDRVRALESVFKFIHPSSSKVRSAWSLVVVVSQSESNYIEGTSRTRGAAAAQLRGCCLNPYGAPVVKEGA